VAGISLAGLTTVALLERRRDISRDLFSRYWRDVHGVMAARIPGFDSYIQNHVTPLTNIGAGIAEQFEGIAVCSFLTPNDRMGLVSSEITGHIHRDEQNVFRRALLYNLEAGASAEHITGDGSTRFFIVIPEGDDTEAVVSQISDNGPLALRTYDLKSGNPSGWNDTDVDDGGTGRMFSMLIEANFIDEEKAVVAAKAAATIADIAAYRVDARYIMVENGRLTTIGLRGLSAAETIADARAINQLDDQVVRAIYGDLGR
jgi:EthD domain